MTVAPVDPQRAEDVRSLARLMDGVLDGIVQAYNQSGVPLPERRYWTLSTPAADCEQVVVSFLNAYIGPPGDEAALPQNCDGPRSAALTAQVLRCVPTVGRSGRAPSGESIQRFSEQLAIDAWLLLDVARYLEQWDPYGGPGLGVIATVDAGGPEGGYQGVTLNLTLGIP